MITPTDPRHGTTKGFHAGCREACCRAAIARYTKVGRLARLNGGRAVPAIGAQRRLQALMRLGWTSADIAAVAGWQNRNRVLQILNGQKGKPCTWIERKTHDTVCATYEALSMRVPEKSSVRTRTANIARRKGWLPPLAWDDNKLDDPNARPHTKADRGRPEDDIDPIVVDRYLNGDCTAETTNAEKFAITAQWLALGRPLRRLERNTGWQSYRYTPDKRKDAA